MGGGVDSWGERWGSQTVGFTVHTDGQWDHLEAGRALPQNPRLNPVAKSSLKVTLGGESYKEGRMG